MAGVRSTTRDLADSDSHTRHQKTYEVIGLGLDEMLYRCAFGWTNGRVEDWSPLGGPFVGGVTVQSAMTHIGGVTGWAELYARGTDGQLWSLKGETKQINGPFLWADDWEAHGGEVSGQLIPIEATPWRYEAGTLNCWLVAPYGKDQIYQIRRIRTGDIEPSFWTDREPLTTGSGAPMQLDWGKAGRDQGVIYTNPQLTDDTNIITYRVLHHAVEEDRVEWVLDSVTEKWKKWLILDNGFGSKRTIQTDGAVTRSSGFMYNYELMGGSCAVWKAETYGKMFEFAQLPTSCLRGGDRVVVRWEYD